MTTVQIIAPPVIKQAEEAFDRLTARIAPLVTAWEAAGDRMRILTANMQGVPTWPTKS